MSNYVGFQVIIEPADFKNRLFQEWGSVENGHFQGSGQKVHLYFGNCVGDQAKTWRGWGGARAYGAEI